MVFLDPTITVRLKLAVLVVDPTVSCSPPGVVWKLRVTVRGSSWRDTLCRRPPESVAVSCSSRYDGYSWSGAVNEPLATPTKLCSGWVWQLDGQWWRIRSQVSAEAGRVPSCGSVAEAEKLITSPTFQVMPAAGALMVAVGAVLPTLTVTVVVAERPPGSVT